MGGCQTAADTIEPPKKISFPTQNNKVKLEKHKFTLPPELSSQLELMTSNGKKIET